MPFKSYFAIINRRQLVTLLMGFSSGLPIALCTSTLQAWYTVAGVSIMTIGLLTLVGQPYIYKFFWAPILDRYVPPFLGRRRGWILIMQLLLAIIIALMALLNPKINPTLLGLLALLVAFFSATQDIGIDAYRTELLKPDERGFGAAMVAGGYRIAMVISGGVAMIMAAKIGWQSTYLIMAALMAAGTCITFWSPEAEKVAAPPKTLSIAIIEPFKEFMLRKGAIAILIFIVLYKLTDAFSLSLGTTFLLRGVGFSLVQVGSIYKIVGISATIIGAFLGGVIMRPLGLYRSLMYFGILQGASNLAFVALALVGKNLFLLVNAVFIENFCSGLGTVAFVAFLMSLCDLRYTATQYAVLGALSAIGRTFVGPIAAIMIAHMGWAEFYLFAALIAIPSLVLLWFIRGEVSVSQQALGYNSNRVATEN